MRHLELSKLTNSDDRTNDVDMYMYMLRLFVSIRVKLGLRPWRTLSTATC